MEAIKKLMICLLAVLFVGFASAQPPDWLTITVRPLHVEHKQKNHYPISDIMFAFEVTITNKSSFRAVLGLNNMTLTVSGHIEAFNAYEKKWENKNNSTYRPFPSFKNVKLSYGNRDVEIMPGATYKNTFYVRGGILTNSTEKFYNPSWFRLHLNYRYLDFSVVTREVSTINTGKAKQSDPGHRR